MVEGRCAVTSKWLLVIFNIVFCFIGGGLIICGTYAYLKLKDYLDFFGDVDINAPAIVLVVFGCITFIIAAVGCLGAFKERSNLLFAFATIIGILLTAEMASGAIAFAFRGKLEGFVKENSVILMKRYNESNDNGVKEAWDTMHKTLECCGVLGPSDWTDMEKAELQGGIVPQSCGNFTNGCVDNFVDFAYRNIVLIGAAGVAFATIQITGIVFACILGCAVKKDEIA